MRRTQVGLPATWSAGAIALGLILASQPVWAQRSEGDARDDSGRSTSTQDRSRDDGSQYDRSTQSGRTSQSGRSTQYDRSTQSGRAYDTQYGPNDPASDFQDRGSSRRMDQGRMDQGRRSEPSFDTARRSSSRDDDDDADEQYRGRRDDQQSGRREGSRQDVYRQDAGRQDAYRQGGSRQGGSQQDWDDQRTGAVDREDGRWSSGRSQSGRSQASGSQASGSQASRSDSGRRGQLGATFSSDAQNRLRIAALSSANSVAARVGLRPGDVVISAAGRPITSQTQLEQLLVGGAAGQRVPLIVQRDGAQRTLFVDAAQLGVQRTSFDEYATQSGDQDRGWLGVMLDTRYPTYAVVDSVQPDSAADEAGLRPGDWIQSVNGQRVQSPGELTQLIQQLEPGEEAELQVTRRETRRLTAVLGQRGERGASRYDVSERPQRGRASGQESYRERQDSRQFSRGDRENEDRSQDDRSQDGRSQDDRSQSGSSQDSDYER